MEEETIRKIIAGEKKTFRVCGYTYTVKVFKDLRIVELSPAGSGSIASSEERSDAYSYTHGGDVYRHAVDVAKEIAKELPTDTDD